MSFQIQICLLYAVVRVSRRMLINCCNQKKTNLKKIWEIAKLKVIQCFYSHIFTLEKRMGSWKYSYNVFLDSSLRVWYFLENTIQILSYLFRHLFFLFVLIFSVDQKGDIWYMIYCLIFTIYFISLTIVYICSSLFSLFLTIQYSFLYSLNIFLYYLNYLSLLHIFFLFIIEYLSSRVYILLFLVSLYLSLISS